MSSTHVTYSIIYYYYYYFLNFIIIIIIINNTYYYGGTITKLYAAGPPYNVKSRNHKLAYATQQQVCQVIGKYGIKL